MYPALALMLVALAAFTVLVVRRRPAGGAHAGRRLDVDQVRGFGYVGAAALGALAVAVMVVGAGHPDRAAGLAVVGFFAFLTYQAAAFVIMLVLAGSDSS